MQAPLARTTRVAAAKRGDALTPDIYTYAFVVDGTIAEGECFIVAYHLRKKEPQQEMIAHGRYLAADRLAD